MTATIDKARPGSDSRSGLEGCLIVHPAQQPDGLAQDRKHQQERECNPRTLRKSGGVSGLRSLGLDAPRRKGVIRKSALARWCYSLDTVLGGNPEPDASWGCKALKRRYRVSKGIFGFGEIWVRNFLEALQNLATRGRYTVLESREADTWEQVTRGGFLSVVSVAWGPPCRQFRRTPEISGQMARLRHARSKLACP